MFQKGFNGNVYSMATIAIHMARCVLSTMFSKRALLAYIYHNTYKGIWIRWGSAFFWSGGVLSCLLGTLPCFGRVGLFKQSQLECVPWIALTWKKLLKIRGEWPSVKLIGLVKFILTSLSTVAKWQGIPEKWQICRIVGTKISWCAYN